jgi:hypothetical protein
MKQVFLVVVVALSLSCGGTVPPTLTPQAAIAYRANTVIVAIGSLQHAGIALNGVQTCDPTGCHPILSDANTRIIVDAATSALETIRSSPDGAKATAVTALAQIERQLDAFGLQQVKPYVQAARAVIAGL